MLFFATNFYSQIGIGTTNPSSAAMLEVSSRTNDAGAYRGLMPPRVPNIAARDGISTGTSDAGLMVFVVDNGNGQACLQIWDGYIWKNGICFVINTLPEIRDLEILGAIQLAGTVNADYTYYDADDDPEGTHIFKWYRADDASGAGQSLITGETTSTYEIASADVGKFLAVEVTPVATTGLSPGTPVMSDYRGPITSGPVWPAIQDFEETSSAPFILPLLSATGGGYKTTGSMYIDERAYGNGSAKTAIVILGPIDVSSASNLSFKLRLAAFGGMEIADIVTISTSTDGTNFSDELIITGSDHVDNHNYIWDFNAIGTASTIWSGLNSPITVNSLDGLNGISYIEITELPNSETLTIRVTMYKNATAELWVIDNAEISGN